MLVEVEESDYEEDEDEKEVSRTSWGESMMTRKRERANERGVIS